MSGCANEDCAREGEADRRTVTIGLEAHHLGRLVHRHVVEMHPRGDARLEEGAKPVAVGLVDPFDADGRGRRDRRQREQPAGLFAGAPGIDRPPVGAAVGPAQSGPDSIDGRWPEPSCDLSRLLVAIVELVAERVDREALENPLLAESGVGFLCVPRA